MSWKGLEQYKRTAGPENPVERCPVQKIIMTEWKIAAYALALPATLRTILCCALVLTLVIVSSELRLFIIFKSECSTATKFRSLLFT